MYLPAEIKDILIGYLNAYDSHPLVRALVLFSPSLSPWRSALYLCLSSCQCWVKSNLSSRALYDKRISQEVEGEALGDEFAGYVSAEWNAQIDMSMYVKPLVVRLEGSFYTAKQMEIIYCN